MLENLVYVGCYLWWALGFAIADLIGAKISGAGTPDWARVEMGNFTSVLTESFEELFAIGGVMSGLVGLVLFGLLAIFAISVLVSLSLAIKRKIGLPSLIIGIVFGIIAGLINREAIEVILLIVSILLILVFCIFDDRIETVFGPFGWIFWWYK